MIIIDLFNDLVEFYNLRHKVYKEFLKELEKFGFTEYWFNEITEKYANPVLFFCYTLPKIPTSLTLNDFGVSVQGEDIWLGTGEVYYRVRIDLPCPKSEYYDCRYIGIPYDYSYKTIEINLDPDYWRSKLREGIKMIFKDLIDKSVADLGNLCKVYEVFD